MALYKNFMGQTGAFSVIGAQRANVRFSLFLCGVDEGCAGRENWLRRQKPGTNFELPETIMGIPFARWGARPFIVHPIQYSAHPRADLLPPRTQAVALRPPARNPIHTALQWQQMLATDNTLCMAEIARKTGVSRARVTQVLNLLALPQDIITYTAKLTCRDDLRLFSERKLRQILAAGTTSDQLAAFHQLRQQCQGS